MSHKGYNRISAHDASHTDTDSSGLAPGKESRSRISCLAAAVTVGGPSTPIPLHPALHPHPPPLLSLPSLSLSHTHTSTNLSSVTGECDSRGLRSLAAAFSLPNSFCLVCERPFYDLICCNCVSRVNDIDVYIRVKNVVQNGEKSNCDRKRGIELRLQ